MRWGVQLAAISILFVGLLVGSAVVLEAGLVRVGWVYVVVLAPMLPLLILPIVAVRYLRTTDELRRKIMSEGLAFGFVATIIALLGLGLLQLAGVANPSWAIVLVLHFGAGALGLVVAARRYV